MPDKTRLARGIQIGSWSALIFLFAVQVHGRFDGYVLVADAFYVLLLGAILLVALNATVSDEGVSQIILGLWLSLLLLYGLEDVQRTVSWHTGLRFDESPWLGYFVVGLIITLVLLVVAFRPVTRLGAISLTVCCGFLIIFLDHVIVAVAGDLRRPMADMVDSQDWSSAWWGLVNWWYHTGDWVRLITYLGLGYIVTRSKGVPFGIIASILVSTADSALSWLAILNYGMTNYSGLWDLQLFWAGIMIDLVMEASILVFVALLGVMTTRVRWGWPSQIRSHGRTA